MEIEASEQRKKREMKVKYINERIGGLSVSARERILSVVETRINDDSTQKLLLREKDVKRCRITAFTSSSLTDTVCCHYRISIFATGMLTSSTTASSIATNMVVYL